MAIDCFSRRVVGWAMRDHLRTELVLEALEMALHTRRPAAGLIHHSDRGSQYTSFAFGRRCREAGAAPSMGSVGDAFDSALAESFAWSSQSRTGRRFGECPFVLAMFGAGRCSVG